MVGLVRRHVLPRHNNGGGAIDSPPFFSRRSECMVFDIVENDDRLILYYGLNEISLSKERMLYQDFLHMANFLQEKFNDEFERGYKVGHREGYTEGYESGQEDMDCSDMDY